MPSSGCNAGRVLGLGRRLTVRIVALVVSAVAVGCEAPRATAPHPPILLITIDTLRADHLRLWGYAGVSTPAIDRLRRDGILFRQAFAHAPLTLPSHVSLLSGRLPPGHGVRDNLGFRLEPGIEPWLPELLRRHRYATGGFVSAYVLRRETGFARGFERFDDALQFAAGDFLGARSRPGSESVRSALAWIDSLGSRPWFAFVHLYEPHAPYQPPEPFAAAYAGAPYDGEIATADLYVGELLDGLRQRGLYDDALVILTSDHGEGLGDHGESEHGVFLYQEDLHVPLILKLPHGERRGEQVDRPVQSIDLVPTVAEQLGLGLTPTPLGSSLLAPSRPEVLLYAESYYGRLHFGWSELTAVFDGRYRYIRAPHRELYDLETDASERRNLIDEQRRVAATLEAALDTLVRPAGNPDVSDQETRRGVGALGYLGGAAAQVDGPRADPKTQLATLDALHAGLAAFQVRRYADAVPLFEKVVDASPAALDAWDYLGRSQRALGRHREALAAFLNADRASGGDPDFTLAAAWSLLDLGRRVEAVRAIERALASPRIDAEFARRLATRLCMEGACEDAISVLRGLPRSDPETRAALEEARSLASLESGHWADAEVHARAALAIDPARPSAWNDLGVAMAKQRKTQAAVEAWRHALALDPRHADSLANLQSFGQVGQR